MPFLHDLRIILVAFAEMPCFIRDSPITCRQFVLVCPPWDVVDLACLEDAITAYGYVKTS